jgi:hypothetical protein
LVLEYGTVSGHENHPRWYDEHLKISEEGYAAFYGYVTFEAAATVFMLDLDDS